MGILLIFLIVFTAIYIVLLIDAVFYLAFDWFKFFYHDVLDGA